MIYFSPFFFPALLFQISSACLNCAFVSPSCSCVIFICIKMLAMYTQGRVQILFMYKRIQWGLMEAAIQFM